MRNLQECQAEVFRRSENRIKEKIRQRRHVLAASVPVVLCIGVLSVFVLPAMKPNGVHGEAVTPNPNFEISTTTVKSEITDERFVGSVEVLGNGISLSHTSDDAVQGIIQMVEQIVSDTETNHEKLEDFSTVENSSTGTTAKKKEYKILIKQGDGSSAEYLLVDSMLIETATQKKFYMDAEVCLALKNALGIPVV